MRITAGTPQGLDLETANTEKEKVNDPLHQQVGGDHYKKMGEYQPWVVLSKWLTKEEFIGAMKKDVLSYLAREKQKGGIQDIEKALHTMQICLKLYHTMEG